MLDVSKVINANLVKALGNTGLDSINEALNSYIKDEALRIENEYANKFDELVESITRKFDDRVEGVIVESVRNTVGDSVNNKMYGLVRDMVGLLENSGIATTEKTKELQVKVNEAERKLVDAYKEFEDVKKEKDHLSKNEYILLQLKGSHPKIIDSALSFFADKDRLDVEDQIGAFIDGDFTSLVGEEGVGSEKLGDIDISMVQDALAGMEKDRDAKKKKLAFNESIIGLKPQRIIGGASRSPNITRNSLFESTGSETNEDINDAMESISSFENIGYRFR